MRYVWIVSLLLVGACAPDAPTALPLDMEVLAAKAPDTHSRANYVIEDSVFVVGPNGEPAAWRGAGLRGDGRLKTGASRAADYTGSEYQGNYCGVYAVLNSKAGENGDFNFTPGADWASTMAAACGPARHYRYYLNGPDDPAPYTGGVSHSFARALYTLAPGASRVQFQGFGAGLPDGCNRLMYNDAYPPSNSPIQTRLADSTRSDGVVVRRWKIESRGSHIAVCGYDGKRGAFVLTGEQYYLPFAITVTEVPYPYPSFP